MEISFIGNNILLVLRFIYDFNWDCKTDKHQIDTLQVH